MNDIDDGIFIESIIYLIKQIPRKTVLDKLIFCYNQEMS
jgi:hypothetical protein